MLEFAFITDIHFGVKANSDVFLENTRRYLHEEFVPYLIENGIKLVIIGGDVFDNRNSLNVKTMNYAFNFFSALEENGFRVIVITGNHDLYLSSSNELSSLPFLSRFENVLHVKDKPIEYAQQGTKLFLVPWISDVDAFINEDIKTDAKICIGHFPLTGFKMNKSSVMKEGMPEVALTRQFDVVISGHYHTRNFKEAGGKKIYYTGSPYQLTWADAGEERGFTLFSFEGDTLKDAMEVNNESCIRFTNLIFPQVFTEDQIKGNFINISVNYNEKFNELELDEYKNKVSSFGPAFKPDIQIINAEDVSMLDALGDFSNKTTSDLLREYIDQMISPDKEAIKTEIMELFSQVKVGE